VNRPNLMRVVDLRGRQLSKRGYQELLPRAPLDINSALADIKPILDSVKHGDESTLLELSSRFDGIAPQSLRVPKAVMSSALTTLDPQLREIITESVRRVRIVHRDQQRGATTTRVVDGGEVQERWVPVDRVGLYVPGGRAVYPSSVVMNVVPAQIAGVPSIAVASPAQKENDGWPHPTILAVCALLGVDEGKQ